MSKKYSNEFSNSKNSTSNLENKFQIIQHQKTQFQRIQHQRTQLQRIQHQRTQLQKTKKIVLININIFYKRNFVFVEAFCNLVQNAFTYVAKNMVQWMKLLVKKRKGIAYEKI